MKYLAVIPARGGSKGIPGKNIKPICGKPLLAWSIESAQASKLLGGFLVSTDDEQIAKTAEKFGAPVLWRPAELATDEARTIDVLRHITDKRPEAKQIVVLQPTSPLRAPGLIDECIKTYESGDYDNLATGFYCKFREFGSHNNERRQDYRGFFYDDGNVYILDRRIVQQGQWCGQKIAFKEISKAQNFEIDDPVDFMILGHLLQNRDKIHE